MKRLVTTVAILALAASVAQGKYIKKRVPLSSPPGQAAVSTHDGKSYVAVANGDKISVFKAEDESFLRDLPVPHAYALAVDSRTGFVYGSTVQDDGGTYVFVTGYPFLGYSIFLLTNTKGEGITALAVDPLAHGKSGQSARIYVANASDQRIDIVSTIGSNLPSIPMPAKPTGITMGPLARLAFVSLANGEVVSISLITQEIVSTIQAGNNLGGIVVDPYGSQRVYALDTDAVEGLDPRATTVRRSFAVPRGTVAGAAFATTTYRGGNSYSYTGNHQIFITGPDGTSALNGISYKVIHTFPNSAGTSVAIAPTSYNKIYVPSSTSNELIVIGGED